MVVVMARSPGMVAFRAAAATFRMVFPEVGLHGFLLLLVKLPILVSVKLLQKLFFEFSAAGFMGCLHGFLLLLIKLPILVGIKLLQKLFFKFSTAGFMARPVVGSPVASAVAGGRLGRGNRGALLGKGRQGGYKGDKK